MASKADGDHVSELSRAMDSAIPVFQPILWLDDMSIAGYESLTRGPSDTALAHPAALFEAARAAGRITELDALMTRRSIEATEDVDWDTSLTLFGNIDPEAMGGPPHPLTMQALERAAAGGTRVVVEVTERSLLAKPSALVLATNMVRMQGFGIAMDDVGVEEDSLTLLPILRPDVVKLDMSILHRPFGVHAARVSGMARLYCDRTGAVLVCEGVETATHEVRARALGADLVQGYRYGAPAPLPAETASTRRPVPLLGREVDERSLGARLASIGESTLPSVQIVALAAELINLVAGHTTAALVMLTAPSFAAVPDVYLDALMTAESRSALVALIAPGCGPEPAAGVRGVDASAEDLLGSPWSISVIGPTMAVSILAGELSADPNDPARYRLIHDRATVAQILGLLLTRIPD